MLKDWVTVYLSSLKILANKTENRHEWRLLGPFESPFLLLCCHLTAEQRNSKLALEYINENLSSRLNWIVSRPGRACFSVKIGNVWYGISVCPSVYIVLQDWNTTLLRLVNSIFSDSFHMQWTDWTVRQWIKKDFWKCMTLSKVGGDDNENFWKSYKTSFFQLKFWLLQYVGEELRNFERLNDLDASLFHHQIQEWS